MIVKKQFLVTVEIDTEKANINAGKWGETYDWDGYPNWEINYGDGIKGALRFIRGSWSDFRQYWKYKGLKCTIKPIKGENE